MRLKIPLLFLCATALCSAQTTFASAGRMLTLEELMETKISISTGTEKTVAEAPSIATVITEEQIARLSATTLFEVLDSIPGLFAYPSASSQFYDNIDIRGLHTTFGAQVVLLINGTPIKRLQNGNTWSRFNFPASLIGRIEVIRGPGSAVYGADAFSGVINVITKDANNLDGVYEAGMRIGSFNKSEVFAHAGTSFENGKIAASISYMTEGNDKDRVFERDQQSVFDTAFGTRASNAPALLQTKGGWLNLALNGSYKDFEINFWGQIARDLGTAAGIGFAIDPQGRYEGDQTVLDVYHRSHPADGLAWEQKLSLSYIYTRTFNTIFPKGALLPIGADGNAFSAGSRMVLFPDGYLGNPSQKQYEVGLESALLVSKYTDHLFRLSVGGKYSKARFYETKNFGPNVIDGSVSPIYGAMTDVSDTPYVFMPKSQRKVFFLSLQDEIVLAPAWILTAGVRDDYYSDFGNTINPRMALVWRKDHSLSIKFLYGRAFRAPAFQELYTSNNPVGQGNTDLQPETMEMKEIGVDYQPSSGWHIGVNIYDYVAANMINAVPRVVGTQFANGGKQSGRGLETIVQYQPSEGILLSVDYAYRLTKDDATGKKAVGAPVHIGRLRADWEFYAHTILAWETQFAADIPRAANDKRAKIANYALSHLTLGYNHNKQLNTKFIARNLFDKKYYYPTATTTLSDYPAPGRSMALQLTYRF
ncbi:MAG TPA: TonB-dependent receptor [Campylobacterales bacterium]|nr:TonB-dependent receptor [Campylobacterales bacterium]